MKLARMLLFLACVLVPLSVAPPPAAAAMAVVDVSAIAKLIEQVRTMQQVLETARGQLLEAQALYQSLSGPRPDLDGLMKDVVRNYLPGNWEDLEGAIQGTISSYGALAAELRSIIDSNAVLTAAQVAALSPLERAQLEASRRSVALLQATTRDALKNTSNRFASIQQLVNAIPRATDQKAIMDLQARIAAEQGMLQNEQIKLDLLERTAEAEERSRQQRVREHAIDDIGSFASLPPMNL